MGGRGAGKRQGGGGRETSLGGEEPRSPAYLLSSRPRTGTLMCRSTHTYRRWRRRRRSSERWPFSPTCRIVSAQGAGEDTGISPTCRIGCAGSTPPAPGHAWPAGRGQRRSRMAAPLLLISSSTGWPWRRRPTGRGTRLHVGGGGGGRNVRSEFRAWLLSSQHPFSPYPALHFPPCTIPSVARHRGRQLRCNARHLRQQEAPPPPPTPSPSHSLLTAARHRGCQLRRCVPHLGQQEAPHRRPPCPASLVRKHERTARGRSGGTLLLGGRRKVQQRQILLEGEGGEGREGREAVGRPAKTKQRPGWLG